MIGIMSSQSVEETFFLDMLTRLRELSRRYPYRMAKIETIYSDKIKDTRKHNKFETASYVAAHKMKAEGDTQQVRLEKSSLCSVEPCVLASQDVANNVGIGPYDFNLMNPCLLQSYGQMAAIYQTLFAVAQSTKPFVGLVKCEEC